MVSRVAALDLWCVSVTAAGAVSAGLLDRVNVAGDDTTAVGPMCEEWRCELVRV